MLKRLELSGFKSFAKKTELIFDAPITAIVGPNGSGKSNIAEAIRWVLGEQSIKSLRGKRGEDLIFAGSKKLPRLSRASVSLVFDNSKKLFDIDFDEVIISRQVFRDGQNIYRLNGSTVRLKDIYELMAKVGLGPSGHHIISQGEADRILFASPAERKMMIEDALGLKIYQYKKKESERKLEKTQENLKEVNLLRREIEPHLKFLKKQMKEIEKAQNMREELAGLYRLYLPSQEEFLNQERKRLESARIGLEKELAEVKKQIKELEEKIQSADQKGDTRALGLLNLEKELAELRKKKDEVSRNLGRVEGKLSARPAEGFLETLPDGRKRCVYCRQIVNLANQGLAFPPEADPPLAEGGKGQAFDLEEEKVELENRLKEFENNERKNFEACQALKLEINQAGSLSRGSERQLFELKTRASTLESKLAALELEENNLRHLEEDFKRELGEARALVGESPASSGENQGPASTNQGLALGSQKGQAFGLEDLRKKIERLKIRLEDAGGINPELVREYQETSSREAFLAREIEDLEKSIKSLDSLVSDLDQTLEEKFKEGLEKINIEFANFFQILFGGGSASLSLIVPKPKRIVDELGIDEDSLRQAQGDFDESESGLDIRVDLPRKKIKSLEQLSGGERALTSIALLFAATQVKPPPFLVLDETDAALDEANSKKYADMLGELSKKSQLILITHNRATMSRAGVLYGVTMPSDSVSALLSVKFDEAAALAA